MSKQIESSSPPPEVAKASEPQTGDAAAATVSRSRPALLPVVTLLLLLATIAVVALGGFKAWQMFQQTRQQTANQILELKNKLASLPTQSDFDNRVRSMQQAVQQGSQKIARLEQRLDSLGAATEKLYELYGRDENGWKLAEVEYLMSVAQHKLALENDFAGAAKTLDAASERIAQLADPGLLPVRLAINDEIAQLKTRARPDLVGMTLQLARLTRQLGSLTPGYQTRVEPTPETTAPVAQNTADPEQPLQRQIIDFVGSLVTIRHDSVKAKATAANTMVVDVSQLLEDNLKLTRWALLDRDAGQYARLMKHNVELFKQYYDLKNAANAEFYDELIQLQKASIKPQLPDISGSLRLLQQIQKKRETSPQQQVPEADNG